MGRQRSRRHLAWQRRSATLTDGREVTWTFDPTEPHPQVITGRVDGVSVPLPALLELLTELGHSDAAAHRPDRSGGNLRFEW